MSFLLLIIGFLFLIKGADLFVDGASSIAKKFKVPATIIGLTVVAMGTSAPEAAVSISSSLSGQNDMCVANVIGSNLFNSLFVLGVLSMITALPVQKSTLKREVPFLLGSSLLLLLFGLNLEFTTIEGLVFLAIFTLFIIITVKTTISNNKEIATFDEAAKDTEEIKELSILKTILSIIIGMTGIILGGDMVVDSATKIALAFGMSANLVGLTIVAFGTSLPELVTSLIAVKKGETEIAIGNVIGSNLFNILLVLGLATSITPITISFIAFIDIVFLLLSTMLLSLFMYKKDNSITKIHGITLTITYLSYMIYTIVR